jgi:opacity protein-like surface antigen
MSTRTGAAAPALAALVFSWSLAAGAAAADFVRVTATRGPIRSEASAASQLITTVPRGTLLEVVARSGEWYRVRLPADKEGRRIEGFIQAGLVTAESAGGPAKPAAPGTKPAVGAAKKPSRFTLRGFATVEYEFFHARQSFDAIFERSTGVPYGGGAELSTGPAFFVQGRITRFSQGGQRAFVHNGEVSRLGIRQTVSMTPIDAALGYRLPWQPGFTPYVTGGIGALLYRDESAEADDSENTRGTFAAYHVGAGVEVPLVKRWLSVAGEVQYRSVPGALGDDGVSRAFGDTNLGGVSVCVKFLVGRQPPRKVRPPKPITKPPTPPAPKRHGVQ